MYFIQLVLNIIVFFFCVALTVLAWQDEVRYSFTNKGRQDHVTKEGFGIFVTCLLLSIVELVIIINQLNQFSEL